MSEPFLGEIRYVAFNFPPRGWAECRGQLMQINQNQALFSLLGTTYGGNGQTTFALPNLLDRVAIGFGQTVLGQQGGEAAHTLLVSEIPSHRHTIAATDARATTADPRNGVVANPYMSSPGRFGFAGTTDGLAADGAIVNSGGSQAHENRQPYLKTLACIALQGIFPSRN